MVRNVSFTAWSTTTSRSSPNVPDSHCCASSAIPPVNSAAPTLARRGSVAGRERFCATASISAALAASRRLASTGFVRPSVNSTRPAGDRWN